MGARLATTVAVVALLWGAAGDAVAAVGPDVVEQAVRARAAADLGVTPADVEVPFLGLGRALACPEAATVTVLPAPGESWRGTADVTLVGVDPAGVTCDRLRLRPRVEAWVAAPVAQAATAPGAPVQVRPGRVRAAEVDGPVVTPGAERWQARVPLAEGEVVTLAKVRAVVDARSGDDVTVVVAAGPLTVKAPGRLMEDATLGGRVRVANLATGAVLTGDLVEPGVVRAGGTP